MEPAAGKRIQGQTVKIGWLKQELDDLPKKLRVLDAVKEVAERITLGDKVSGSPRPVSALRSAICPAVSVDGCSSHGY